MSLSRSAAERAGAIALCAVMVAVPMLIVGCSDAQPKTGTDTATRSQDITPGEFPDVEPPKAIVPPPPMLKEPSKAVYSYLLWISYAYRILNSDVATHAFSVWEEVHVNSYVEFNREKRQAIDQRLVDFKITGIKPEKWQSETTVTVTARESWRYRYIDTATVKYRGPAYSATYDTVYTVVKTPKVGWLVDSVKATPIGGQPK